MIDLEVSGEAVENVMLPVSSFREGPRRDALTSTDSASGILTAIKYRGEILGPTIRPYTGAVGPGLPPDV